MGVSSLGLPLLLWGKGLVTLLQNLLHCALILAHQSDYCTHVEVTSSYDVIKMAASITAKPALDTTTAGKKQKLTEEEVTEKKKNSHVKLG